MTMSVAERSRPVRLGSASQLIRALPAIIAYDLGVIAITATRQRSLAPVRGKFAALRQIGRIRRDRPRLPYLPRDAFAAPLGVRAVLRERRLRDRLEEGIA